MADRDAVADLVGTIYEASMDVALWPVVLDRIATHFDASSSSDLPTKTCSSVRALHDIIRTAA